MEKQTPRSTQAAMEQQAKKLSLLEYRRKKQQTASVEHEPSEGVVAPPSEPTLKPEPEPIAVVDPVMAEIDMKLAQLLDHLQQPIPDRVLQLPTMMRHESHSNSKLAYTKFILQHQLLNQFPLLQESDLLRDILYNWLKVILIKLEQSKMKAELSSIELQLLFCIFDLVQQFNFSSDFLSTSKYPKVINKFLEFPQQEVQQKARRLMNAWNLLNERRPEWKEGNLPGDKGDGSGGTMTMEGKRMLAMEKEHSKSKRIPKKRVSFAPDDLLVQIRYFELEADESVHKRRSNYHESEQREASFALQRRNWLDKPQLLWQTPSSITGIPMECRLERGVRSEERGVQEEREKKVLSATYYSIQHIPSTPGEAPSESGIPDVLVPTIPLFEVAHSQSLFQANQGTLPVGSFDPNALASLIKNQNLFKQMQNKT